jgi:hypothetical protein
MPRTVPVVPVDLLGRSPRNMSWYARSGGSLNPKDQPYDASLGPLLREDPRNHRLVGRQWRPRFRRMPFRNEPRRRRRRRGPPGPRRPYRDHGLVQWRQRQPGRWAWSRGSTRLARNTQFSPLAEGGDKGVIRTRKARRHLSTRQCQNHRDRHMGAQRSPRQEQRLHQRRNVTRSGLCLG